MLGNAYVTGLRDKKVKVIQGQISKNVGNRLGTHKMLAWAYVTCLCDRKWSRSSKVKVEKLHKKCSQRPQVLGYDSDGCLRDIFEVKVIQGHSSRNAEIKVSPRASRASEMTT